MPDCTLRDALISQKWSLYEEVIFFFFFFLPLWIVLISQQIQFMTYDMTLVWYATNWGNVAACVNISEKTVKAVTWLWKQLGSWQLQPFLEVNVLTHTHTRPPHTHTCYQPLCIHADTQKLVVGCVAHVLLESGIYITHIKVNMLHPSDLYLRLPKKQSLYHKCLDNAQIAEKTNWLD